VNKADEIIALRGVLAGNMRRLRGVEGWSQEELADRCELHRTYIGDIERLERNVSIDNIGRIARAFGITASKLLAESQ
jgi:transcriptional regulator with XRE-family HTH domain